MYKQWYLAHFKRVSVLYICTLSDGDELYRIWIKFASEEWSCALEATVWETITLFSWNSQNTHDFYICKAYAIRMHTQWRALSKYFVVWVNMYCVYLCQYLLYVCFVFGLGGAIHPLCYSMDVRCDAYNSIDQILKDCTIWRLDI